MKKDLPAKGSEWVRLILSGLVFLAFIPATILALPKVMELSDPQARLQFQQELQSLGIGGWLTFLGIQVLQVVVAMIPGEPVEILAGLLYGPLWGTLSCMLGILIGSLIVYFLVRRLGMPIVSIFGTPKDLLTWAAGFVRINPLRFFLIATVARLPSILSSTLAGASLISGDFLTTVIIFAVTGCVSLIGVLLHKKLGEKKTEENPKERSKKEMPESPVKE